MTAMTAAPETAYKTKFERFITGEANAELAEERRRAFKHFEENGFPTPTLEDWKYTNPAIAKEFDTVIRPVVPVNGNFDREALGILKRFDSFRNGFTSLNAAFAEISVIRIPKETALAEPIVLNFTSDDEAAAFPHVIVIAEAGSKATIVEHYDSERQSFTNAAVQIVIEDNAAVRHYRVQKDSLDAFNYGVTEVTIGRGASYDATSINLGGALSRHDIDVKFTAEGGEAWVDGLFMLDGAQHHDTHSILDHTVPNCTSHQTYRGVLNGDSRGVFNGKVFVRRGAHGTDAEQSNKNLLLSNTARVDTKPQLEIFNEDVKCSHGATVGQLEEEELFYLLTRGLPEQLARNLLTYGFAEEIINKIEIDSIKQDLDAAVLNRLNAEI
ncbi:MAG: Fe-S cluster assembly protein SufD [Chloracidobacterium sp.]|nr:Fe-S cluster assembly protein SufD [Chloracidobacterium sp.]